MRVLVTGAFGWTARPILQALHERGHEVVALDNAAQCPDAVREIASRIVVADVRDRFEVLRIAGDADAALHLAVTIGSPSYTSPEVPFAVNVLGTYNLFEAARQHSMSRVVLMSEASVHLPDAQRNAAPSSWRSSPGDDHLYDMTKRLQEEIAKDYSETYGLSVVTLRIGHVVDGRAGVDRLGKHLTHVTYCRGGWVCRYDVAAAVVAALAVPIAGYVTYNVVGAWQARRRYDIERTEAELGVTLGERFQEYA